MINMEELLIGFICGFVVLWYAKKDVEQIISDLTKKKQKIRLDDKIKEIDEKLASLEKK
jgi:hypothetical protein